MKDRINTLFSNRTSLAVLLSVSTLGMAGCGVADQTAPVITVTAGTDTINNNDTFIDAGATALDNVDGVLSPIVTGSVDTSTDGTYTLTYNISDAAGNAATPATRDVVVRTPGTVATALAGITDEALKTCLTTATNGQIKASELRALTCSAAGITDLTGLGQFSKITTLKLMNNVGISNLDALSTLNLRVLNLTGTTLDNAALTVIGAQSAMAILILNGIIWPASTDYSPLKSFNKDHLFRIFIQGRNTIDCTSLYDVMSYYGIEDPTVVASYRTVSTPFNTFDLDNTATGFIRIANSCIPAS